MADRTTKLRDALIRHRIGLLRLAAGLSAKYVEVIDGTESQLELLVRRHLAALRDASQDPRSPEYALALTQFRNDVAALRAGSFDEVSSKADDEFTSLVKAEWAFLLLAASLSKDETVTLADGFDATDAAAHAIVANLVFQGQNVAGLFDTLAAGDAKNIRDAVDAGLTQDATDAQIIASIVGTQGQDGEDGVTQQSRNGVEAIVGTAVGAFSAAARNQFMQAATDIFDREQFTAVLDSHTTPICRSVDGNVYPVGEGPIPPLHYRCRSFRVPIVIGDAPPDRQTYPEWLASQDAGTQDDILGVARGRLFREGEITLDMFVDETGQQYTLEELARKNREAFVRAGLDPSKFGA